jgi:hypothetical protein
MEVVAHVGFRVWLRNVAQAEMSALVHCHGRFSNSLTTTLLVACGILHRRDTAEHVNNIPYLLCGPLEQTHDTQCLDGRKL